MNRNFLRALMVAASLLAARHAGAAYQRLHSFGDAAHSARTPMAGLTDGGDGYFYGVSRYAIGVSAGTIFKLRPDGSDWSVVYSFMPVYPNGQEIYSHLAITNGVLYGTRNASFTGSSTSLAYSVNTNGGAYTVLHNFSGFVNDGKTSSGGLVFDASGILYGVTSGGGTNNGGAIFKMQTNGSGYMILRSFDNQFLNNGTSARTPIGELALDANNFLYGVTSTGGGSTNGGTVFKLKTDGTGFAQLLDFPATAGDGYNPMTGLTLDGAGNLFGVTASGGTNDVGVAFKLKTDGTGYARLHDFAFDSTNVFSPDEKLFLGGDGLLYGASANGGTHSGGGLFKLATDGSTYSVFYHATGGAGGSSFPVGGITWLPGGTVIGEAASGGTLGEGSIFKVQSDGNSFTTLASFTVAHDDTMPPESGLTLGNNAFSDGTTVTFPRGTNLTAWTSVSSNTLLNNPDSFAVYLEVSPPTPRFTAR